MAAAEQNGVPPSELLQRRHHRVDDASFLTRSDSNGSARGTSMHLKGAASSSSASQQPATFSFTSVLASLLFLAAECAQVLSHPRHIFCARIIPSRNG